MYSVGDRLLLENSTISTFLKSWIVFYSVGLKDEFYRGYLLNLHRDSKPWDRSHSVFDPIWSYNPDLCHYIGIEVLSVEEAAFEWQQFIDNWANVCLFSNEDSFEVILTNNGSGLGLRTKSRIRFNILSDYIDGFLEFVSERLFDTLASLQYRSLYTYVDSDGERHYCVLFGPLSLANAFLQWVYQFWRRWIRIEVESALCLWN